MPLVAAKCTQCGANIEVDDTKEAGICKYCGTAFITEKAINNYNTYITNNNNFAGANVVVQGSTDDVEQYITRAETFLKLNEYKQAYNIYKDICFKFPMDYRGWIGEVISYTENYTKINEYSYEFYLGYFDKALKVASSDKKDYILQQKHLYEEAYTTKVKRQEDGRYIAKICNQYDYRDVEKALGCKCLTSQDHTFVEFILVIEHHVECNATYMGLSYQDKESGYKVEKKSSNDISTCEKYVTRDNIEELLSGYTKKHNLSNSSSGSGGCYVATCVYGSYDCPEVWTLRRFRDHTLDTTWYGRLFIKCYYAISPTIVKWFGETKWFKSFWKARLDKMVSNLNNRGVENTSYTDKY